MAVDGVSIRSLRHGVEWSGTGLHSGCDVSVRVEPSCRPGIRFDLGGVEVPALAECAVSTVRSTTLGANGVSVSTVEHLLAALTGCGVWAAVIRPSGPEIPILDGSARPFVDAVLDAGTDAIGEWLPIVPDAGGVTEGDASRIWAPRPHGLDTEFIMGGRHPMLVGQIARMVDSTPERFLQEVAPARTWALAEEVEALRSQGLIRGGSLDNALVVCSDQYSSELRSPNEPACHKLLDFLGDLVLAGRPVHGTVRAIGGGHALNVRAAAALAEGHRRGRIETIDDMEPRPPVPERC